MTNKQKRFADEYVIDCNATRAYKAAYPNIKSDDVARANGSRLLSKANVKEYVNQLLDKISDQKIAKAAEVMEYLTKVLRGDSKSEVIAVEFVGDGMSEARRVQKLPDEKERFKAAELLGKRYGMFKENIGVTGSGTVVIVDDVKNTDE